MTSRLYFKEELAKLNSDILEMGEQIESGITKTMNAVKNLDGKAAQELIDGDDAFDHQERAIEKYCIDLVIRESPISSDWRKIASVMRIVSDLERIADHFSDIAEYILRLDGLGTAGACPEYFDAMFGVVKNMLSDTIRAFVEYDAKLSATVI
ncbi:MAG: phosphate signaling complex PhoU family protein, partial [Oscillospiraceae bacterium]